LKGWFYDHADDNLKPLLANSSLNPELIES